MKRPFHLLLVFSLLHFYCHAQVREEELVLLRKLDSLRQSHSISRHFAELYFTTTIKVARAFSGTGEKGHDLMQRMETRFADFFFRSADAYKKGEEVPPEWKSYYSSEKLSPLQYQLLGINAHINGDIWQALTREFTMEELRLFDQYYFLLKKALILEYKEFYSRSGNERFLKCLHILSLGLDKLYGRFMLGHWRRRQYKLAQLWFSDKKKFSIKFKKLQKKMNILDRMVLRHF